MCQVSVIIPSFNEKESIQETISSIRQTMDNSGKKYEIIVVDDGSADGTAELAESAGSRVIRHPVNSGYGASLKTGIRAASGEIIAITDADGTYPVGMIPVLLAKMEETKASMVVGSRDGQNVSIPLIRRPFKRFLRFLAAYIVQKPIPDLNSGLRVFTRKLALRYFHLYPNGFSFTSTITVASMCDNFPVEFVSINYFKRTGKSKICYSDFFGFLNLVLKLSVFFKPMRVFLPVSMFCFFLGMIKLAHDIYISLMIANSTGTSMLLLPVVSATAVTLFISSLMIVLVGMVAEALARQNSSLESIIDGRI